MCFFGQILKQVTHIHFKFLALCKYRESLIKRHIRQELAVVCCSCDSTYISNKETIVRAAAAALSLEINVCTNKNQNRWYALDTKAHLKSNVDF